MEEVYTIKTKEVECFSCKSVVTTGPIIDSNRGKELAKVVEVAFRCLICNSPILLDKDTYCRQKERLESRSSGFGFWKHGIAEGENVCPVDLTESTAHSHHHP